MIEYRNNWVGCPPETGCLGNDCPNVNVKYCVCDMCHDDVETLYVLDCEELCLDCLCEVLPKIEVDDE